MLWRQSDQTSKTRNLTRCIQLHCRWQWRVCWNAHPHLDVEFYCESGSDYDSGLEEDEDEDEDSLFKKLQQGHSYHKNGTSLAWHRGYTCKSLTFYLLSLNWHLLSLNFTSCTMCWKNRRNFQTIFNRCSCSGNSPHIEDWLYSTGTKQDKLVLIIMLFHSLKWISLDKAIVPYYGRLFQ